MDGGYKHCIANNCESSRKRNQSIISERAIRELYFKAFEVAMKVHMPKSIMTAYNAVNGVPHLGGRGSDFGIVPGGERFLTDLS